MKFRRMTALGVAVAALLSGCTGAPDSASSTNATGTTTVDPQILSQTWSAYKSAFIQGDGRVIDHERNQDTTSEGQAYAMLRSVWMDDRQTFDSVHQWAQHNLRSGNSSLWGFLWGPDGGGSYHLLNSNPASDADQDAALALLFAARRWQDQSYRAAALAMLDGIWNSEVSDVAGTPVMAAGPWATSGGQVVINPSYFEPYAYRIFAAAQPGRAWPALVTSSYRFLRECSNAGLGTGGSVNLPPNWCALDRSSGHASSYTTKQGGDDYGYDAFRVMWRLAVDVQWNNDPQARSYLATQSFLLNEWASKQKLAAVYTHDGKPSGGEDPAVYGGDIGLFAVISPQQASAIAGSKLLSSLKQDGGSHFGDPQNYFAQNWAWFGLALQAGVIRNLAT